MINLIAETAWHHEGDFVFMKDLVSRLCEESKADVIKMHITLDIDEYMRKDHASYALLKSWLFAEDQWAELIECVEKSDKQLMLLLNDTSAAEFGSHFNPSLVELHSVCLNVQRLQNAVLDHFTETIGVVVGIGGSTIEEIRNAISAFRERKIVLMFGFQNYPTNYSDINLKKINKIQRMFPSNVFGYADHSAWNESNNELITLLVASNEMQYVEKHTSTTYGEKRCDFEAAISIEMLNSLKSKLLVCDEIYGNGGIDLNEAELSYSIYGPMKMAAIANCNVEKGEQLERHHFSFSRTSQISDMSQVEVNSKVGSFVKTPLVKSKVINRINFE